MLDIIITHYTEPWEVCRSLFETLDAQRGVDWQEIRVTVINDGGFRLPEDKLACLNIVPQQLDVPQGGVSAARNAGIRIAREPWIMFCDCDDCFSNVFALEGIMNVLRVPGTEQKYDMLWTKVWAEHEVCGRRVVYMIPDRKIFIFIHGKVYRREFLLEEGIRFDESLKYNEDSLFNATILTRRDNTRIGAVSSFAPEYVWCMREGSVSRISGVDDLSAVGQFHRNLALAEETRTHKPAAYPGIVTRVMYDTYYMIHSGRLSESCKQQILREFAPWAGKRADLFGQVDKKQLRQIREIGREELTLAEEDLPDDPVTVRKWLTEVAQT